MNNKQLEEIGIIDEKTKSLVLKHIKRIVQSGKKVNVKKIKEDLINIINKPSYYFLSREYGQIAISYNDYKSNFIDYKKNKKFAQYNIYGEDIEHGAISQMEDACKLPVAVAGALMPDAHEGYGLPIGGVLATRNAVIPYAVGVDIACRMKLSVLDLPLNNVYDCFDDIKCAIEKSTRFGNNGFSNSDMAKKISHKVMDNSLWNNNSLLKSLKDYAWSQLGTSGGGNHFVDIGILEVKEDIYNLSKGKYVAIISHSGSRGAGYKVAKYYSEIAKNNHKELPKNLSNLAWLDMDSDAGIDYWDSMNLMGEYAAANHEIIHNNLEKNMNCKIIYQVENHHNFAWKEQYNKEEVIVHRKGATPAHKGVLGIIPGSMATPAFLVRGLGNESFINSCSHGAGRLMSRSKAKDEFIWDDVNSFLKENKVKLLSGGLDESPFAYKDIERVMSFQKDSVEVLAKFYPKIVKMSGD